VAWIKLLPQEEPIPVPISSTCLVASDRGTTNAEPVITKRLSLIFVHCKLQNFNANMSFLAKVGHVKVVCFSRSVANEKLKGIAALSILSLVVTTLMELLTLN